jgi:membrane protein implicated in regulation of membrane protease activity|tara:strand:- start:169 stop:456 length:288 start_codon:yes stop_codon:yes gene_type:complete
MIESFLFSGNIWLIIGLALAIIELTSGTLIFFLPMGLSGLLTGMLLKLQESESISHLISDWTSALIFWAVLSLILSLMLNLLVKKKDTVKDVNDY